MGFAARWTLRLGLLLAVLLLASYFLIQVPAVQRYAARQTADAISAKLGVDVGIGQISLVPFTRVALHDVRVGDERGDTLIAAERLVADLREPLRSLLNRTLFVQSVELEGARLDFRRDADLPDGNYAFLQRLFAPEPTTDYTARDPFQFNLTRLRITHSGVALDDRLAGLELAGRLDTFDVFFERLDLPGKQIVGNTIDLFGAELAVTRRAPAEGAPADPAAGPAPGAEAEPAAPRPFLTPFTVTFDDVTVARGAFRLRDLTRGPAPAAALFDPADVRVRDVALRIADLALLRDSLGLRLRHAALAEEGGFRLYDLAAQTVALTPRALLLDEFVLQTARSRFGDRVAVDLPPGATWAEALRRGRLQLDLKPSTLAVSELVAFAPALAGRLPFAADGKIQLRGRVRGTADRLRAEDLALRLPDGTRLRADVSARNLTQREEAFVNLELAELRTSAARVRRLLPELTLPPNLDRLGDLTFAGRFDGFLDDFVAYGDLRSEIGRLTLDTRFASAPGQPPRYTGELVLEDFDVGAFAGQPDLGRVTARADVRDGRGLRPGEISLDVIGNVDAVRYRGYVYRDVAVNGRFDPAGYEGALTFKDEHADLDFDGKIDLGGGDDAFDFSARVRRLDPGALGLTASPWSYAGDLEIRSSTLDLDNLDGDVRVRDFAIAHPDGRRYGIDSLTVRQRRAPDGEKRLTLASPFVAADLSGTYQLRRLPGQLGRAFAKTYPELAARLRVPAYRPDSLDAPARLSLEGKVLEVDSLLRTFGVPVRGVAGSQFALTLDTDTERLDFSLTSAAPRVGGVTLDNLALDLLGQGGELALEATAQGLGLGAYGFSDLAVFTEYADEDIRFSVSADTATSVLGEVNFAGAVELADTAVALSLDPSSHVDIAGERWTVEPGNELVLGRRRVVARDVELTAGERFIALETIGERGLNVLLRKLDLGVLNAYLNPDKLRVAGEVDAYFTAADLYAREGISFSASVDTLRVNGVDWGALQTLATLPAETEALTTYTTFTRLGQQAVLDGAVALRDGVRVAGAPRPRNYFDARLASDRFDMSFLSYFIPGITDLEGALGADLHVYGTPDDMTPEGGILVDDCALTIDYLQTRYFIDSQYVRIDERILDASNRVIRDRFGNRAVITGGLVHEGLLKWSLDVALRTDRLSVLNTDRYDNPLYYGEAFARGRVAFSGPFNQTDIDIDAAALGGSRVVFPVSGTSGDSELRFIDFRQPDDTVRQDVATFLRGINLDMDIEVTPTAELLIVFDEAAGDILRGQGTGDIQIDVRRSGSYSMFGTYNVQEGDYLFTLLNVVNKPFSIRPGGTIRWEGDPFTAQLDLTAQYEGLTVAPFGLIPEYQSALQARGDGSLLELAYQPTDVDLLLQLDGDLLRPGLSFEIEMPDLQGDLRNYVNSKLALIRQDENELNRQVFGLIVIGQFLPNFTDLQASTVGFNTVTELFSNQLSYLLTELFTSLAGSDGALSGIDIDINLQNNSSLSGGIPRTGNDLNTRLRTYFFDDRLEVGIGANFGQTFASAGSGTLTAGKFEVAYALTDDRRLRLKTFASTAVDLGNRNRNRAGVGLSWRRQFDDFGELFGAARKAARREDGPPRFETAGG